MFPADKNICVALLIICAIAWIIVHIKDAFVLAGHGFKLAPVVGKVLAEMAMGKKPSYDLTPFKMNRFGNQAKL